MVLLKLLQYVALLLQAGPAPHTVQSQPLYQALLEELCV